ncbi:MAG: amino acid permease [Bryobacterales bacterium]|nr:amino acid permease [Bryobacterales bacterium]
MSELLTVKSLAVLTAEADAQGEHTLKRALGPWHLTGLGVGAIIGAGIFVLTGEAAFRNAGPAVVLSFLGAGIACAFAALCYAEFASLIPIAGSAYTYAYATLGEIFAWTIGWDLVLEYALAASTVSVGWSGYCAALLSDFGIRIPEWAHNPYFALNDAGEIVTAGGFNILAFGIVLVTTVVLAMGIEESAKVNAVIVFIKVAIVLIFLAAGVGYINSANWTPFIPANTGEFGHYGWSGILRGSSLVFFAYIGFDAVSTAAQEAKNPKRDLPIGILASLVLCTSLYIAVSAVLTGLVPYTELGVPHPISVGIRATPYPWLRFLVDLGAVLGLGSVMLVMLLGQSRVFYAMSRDGLLPKAFSRVHPRFRTPFGTTLATGAVVAIPAALFPISVLGHMVNIGTLLAFIIVCLAVIILRVRRPDLHRPFKAPFFPWLPIGGIITSFALMLGLPSETWERLLIWLALGMLIYFTYGRRHSVARKAA